MEACVGARLLATPGVMKGFLQHRCGILTTPLSVERGRMALHQASLPRLDPAAVAAARVAREEFYGPAGVRMTAP
jgi:hypothetical protein